MYNHIYFPLFEPCMGRPCVCFHNHPKQGSLILDSGGWSFCFHLNSKEDNLKNQDFKLHVDNSWESPWNIFIKFPRQVISLEKWDVWSVCISIGYSIQCSSAAAEKRIWWPLFLAYFPILRSLNCNHETDVTLQHKTCVESETHRREVNNETTYLTFFPLPQLRISHETKCVYCLSLLFLLEMRHEGKRQ